MSDPAVPAATTLASLPAEVMKATPKWVWQALGVTAGMVAIATLLGLTDAYKRVVGAMTTHAEVAIAAKPDASTAKIERLEKAFANFAVAVARDIGSQSTEIVKLKDRMVVIESVPHPVAAKAPALKVRPVKVLDTPPPAPLNNPNWP